MTGTGAPTLKTHYFTGRNASDWKTNVPFLIPQPPLVSTTFAELVRSAPVSFRSFPSGGTAAEGT